MKLSKVGWFFGQFLIKLFLFMKFIHWNYYNIYPCFYHFYSLQYLYVVIFFVLIGGLLGAPLRSAQNTMQHNSRFPGKNPLRFDGRDPLFSFLLRKNTMGRRNVSTMNSFNSTLSELRLPNNCRNVFEEWLHVKKSPSECW